MSRRSEVPVSYHTEAFIFIVISLHYFFPEKLSHILLLEEIHVCKMGTNKAKVDKQVDEQPFVSVTSGDFYCKAQLGKRSAKETVV